MHTMELKDGRTFTPINNEDVLDQVYEYMGKDMYDFISEKIVRNDMEAMIAEKKFNSDFNAIESENEGYMSALDEIQSIVQNLWCYIEDAKKLDRQKIIAKLKDINTEISNVR